MYLHWCILCETLEIFRLSVSVCLNVKSEQEQMNLEYNFFLTCDWELSGPPDHKVPEQQLARVIPNVIFSHFLDRQSVPLPLYGLPPLLRLAFLYLHKQKDTNKLQPTLQ